MKKPRHQLILVYASWIMAGFMALAGFLDGISNAISLITFPIALTGTIVIVVVLISAQLYVIKYPLPWVINGETVKISKLNLALILPFLGMIILLWIPIVFKPEVAANVVPQVALAKVTDDIQVSSVKTVVDSRTEIHEAAGNGIITAYWEVLLSNVGDKAMSVVDYKIIQVGKDFPVSWYTDMDQGLYSFENGLPIKESLPIDILSGGTKKVFVRIGLMMTPEVSQLVKNQLYSLPASEATLKKVWRFLYAKETDFYGNKLTNKYLDGSKKMTTVFPDLKNLREQEFVVAFTTSRGQSVKEPLSWYKFGGSYDERRYQMQ